MKIAASVLLVCGLLVVGAVHPIRFRQHQASLTEFELRGQSRATGFPDTQRTPAIVARYTYPAPNNDVVANPGYALTQACATKVAAVANFLSNGLIDVADANRMVGVALAADGKMYWSVSGFASAVDGYSEKDLSTINNPSIFVKQASTNDFSLNLAKAVGLTENHAKKYTISGVDTLPRQLTGHEYAQFYSRYETFNDAPNIKHLWPQLDDQVTIKTLIAKYKAALDDQDRTTRNLNRPQATSLSNGKLIDPLTITLGSTGKEASPEKVKEWTDKDALALLAVKTAAAALEQTVDYKAAKMLGMPSAINDVIRELENRMDKSFFEAGNPVGACAGSKLAMFAKLNGITFTCMAERLINNADLRMSCPTCQFIMNQVFKATVVPFRAD